MSAVLSEEIYGKISQILSDNLGMYFPPEKKLDLERELNNARISFGYNNYDEFIQWILSAELKRKQVETFANHLTIGETYFFREEKIFEILEQTIIPGIIKEKKSYSNNLRIWSAGCSTGEEAYSIAMLIDKMKDVFKDWKIQILATDINPTSLKKAAEGIYGEWSFRTTPAYMKEKYFTALPNNRYKIKDEIKKKVKFDFINLADETFPQKIDSPGSIDIIFCRNVLMYFNNDLRNKIVAHFHNLLNNSGWLIVSSSEVSQKQFDLFNTANFTNAILYTKSKSYKKNYKTEIFPEYKALKPGINNLDFKINELKKVAIQKKIEKPVVKKNKPTIAESIIIKSAEEEFDNGKFYEVIESLELALSDSKQYFVQEELLKGYQLLAKAYANIDQLNNAKKWCEKAISVEKMNHSIHYLLASILIEDELKDEAVISLKHALFLEPDFILAMFSLGTILMKQNKINEAKKQYSNALLVLSKFDENDLVPESDGLTVSGLKVLIQSLL